jgi:hypothetical protein
MKKRIVKKANGGAMPAATSGNARMIRRPADMPAPSGGPMGGGRPIQQVAASPGGGRPVQQVRAGGRPAGGPRPETINVRPGPGGGRPTMVPGGNRPMPAPPGGGGAPKPVSLPPGAVGGPMPGRGQTPPAVLAGVPKPRSTVTQPGNPMTATMPGGMAKGGAVKKMAAGGSASKRADGVATHGKTKGKFI